MSDKILWLGGKGQGMVVCGVVVEAVFPEFVQRATAVEATQGEDVAGAGFELGQPGLFAASADDGLAFGFDHGGADEVSGRPECAELYAIHIADKVSQK